MALVADDEMAKERGTLDKSGAGVTFFDYYKANGKAMKGEKCPAHLKWDIKILECEDGESIDIPEGAMITGAYWGDRKNLAHGKDITKQVIKFVREKKYATIFGNTEWFGDPWYGSKKGLKIRIATKRVEAPAPAPAPAPVAQPAAYPAAQPAAYPAAQPAAYPAAQPAYPAAQPAYPAQQPAGPVAYPPVAPAAYPAQPAAQYPPAAPAAYPAAQPAYPAAQPAYPADAATLMTITVPQGVNPGQAIQVQTPAGATVQATVPAGVFAGQTFQISVPAARTVAMVTMPGALNTASSVENRAAVPVAMATACVVTSNANAGIPDSAFVKH